jgi:hypothetical protein
MEDTRKKMLLAALSQCVAEKDKAAANISFILEHGCIDISNNIVNLKKEFDNISQAELTIEAIQMYYAKHFPLPKEKEEENK